jgi:hypothetical protein
MSTHDLSDLTDPTVLLNLLIADRMIVSTGEPTTYPGPDEWLAAGHDLLDLPTVMGKPLRECTFGECRLMGLVYMRLAERLEGFSKPERKRKRQST